MDVFLVSLRGPKGICYNLVPNPLTNTYKATVTVKRKGDNRKYKTKEREREREREKEKTFTTYISLGDHCTKHSVMPAIVLRFIIH